MDENMIGFLWVPMGSLIVFSRLDEKEAEIIEEMELRRHQAVAAGDLSRDTWDIICDFDELIDHDSD